MVVFENVSFGYTHKKVLKAVNLKIKKGQSVGIVGANGAGKSTLIKLMTGLIIPTEGRVLVDGMDVSSKAIKAIRKKVGYTFQDPNHQLFMPTVFEDVAFGLRQEGLSKKEVEDRVTKILKEVDALHLSDRPSYTLSGGEKRTVTLATALSTNPEILILDEPSIGLDPRSRRGLIRLLTTRNETKIITTHDMDMALDLCDRIIVLYEAKIQGDGEPMTIFKNKALLCQSHLELPLRMQGCPVCSK